MPSSPDNTVKLTVGNAVHAGWQEVTVNRTMEAISGSFELAVTERWPGQQKMAAVKPQDPCKLMIGSDVVITGHVDDVMPEYDGENHRVTFTGRDATGDLVDCSAEMGQFAVMNMDFVQLVSALAKPYGIKVYTPLKFPPLAYFMINPGETVFEAIDRLSARVGALPMSDGRGGLMFVRAGDAGRHSGLILGENIIRARGQYSDRKRYSDYLVLGQAPGSPTISPETSAFMSGTAKDPGVSRFRKLIINAQIIDNSAQPYQTRAQWEATVRLGRAQRHEITVQGWRDAAGVLWQPNRLLRVEDDFLAVHGDMLLSGVKLRLSEDGMLADLTITRKEAFDVIPMPTEEDFALGPRAPAGPAAGP